MFKLEGVVVSGLKEGQFFMSKDHYKKEIKEKLKIEAYPGTLNVRVKKDNSDKIKNHSSIMILGFKESNKNFGGLKCYKAKIKDINGFIIIPEFNKHKEDVIEFISETNMRSELNLEDGEEIEIELK